MIEQAPINVVGSSVFGRYPKIDIEKTWNMFVSDQWLVNFAGYVPVSAAPVQLEGRALFRSVRDNIAVMVCGSAVYKVDPTLGMSFIGNLNTVTGEVSIDENLAGQICICDGQDAWIYNVANNSLTQQALTDGSSNPIKPSYVAYHNTYFLITGSDDDVNSSLWFAYERFNDTQIGNISAANTPVSEQTLQTKPDAPQAVKRIPGKGNNVLVLGNSVAEVWTQVGGVDNYRRVQSFNIDVGTASRDTVAASSEFVAWLAINENNEPAIYVTNGGQAQRISTDGIDYLLSTVKFPAQSTAMFYRQDGHLFYQLTFYNEDDNFTIAYDFNTKMFFNLSDENQDYHPARQIIYMNNESYFVSLNDNNIYRMSTEIDGYGYNINDNSELEEIPRIRLCKTIRKANSDYFRVRNFTFWIEMGLTSNLVPDFIITEEGELVLSEDGDFLVTEGTKYLGGEDTLPRVLLKISKNGNQSFITGIPKKLNDIGKYRNKISWSKLGKANEFTIQLQFWGLQRFVANDGIAEIY